jgi:hypothetical protein
LAVAYIDFRGVSVKDGKVISEKVEP